MCETKFYICKHCGNFVGMINCSGVPMLCCGEEMTALVPNTVDASHEKHVPVAEIKDGVLNVKIGSIPHPMTEEHHIAWIYVEYANGGQRKCFKVGDEPEMNFCLCENEKPIAVYEYCNLHGLWKATL
ncbi:MAG TPA: desulfoferrodoxin [Clostridiales bacterium]|nr:desulfoferrodoxin [Clostridiales bacterium]